MRRKSPVVVFLDRNLGSKKVPEILRSISDVPIEIHDDHYPADTKDPELLADVGAKNWLFISNDKRIRYNNAAQYSIRSSKCAFFYLAAQGNLSAEETADILSKALDKVISFSFQHRPPYIAKIMRGGIVKLVKSF